MVTLSLIVEGGVYPQNVDASTASNVEALRQSLHSFFSRLLNRDDISIKLHMGQGYSRMEENISISNHSVIKGKEIEEISKPSQKLTILMKKFFKKGKKGASYGKLKTSPGLLDALNAEDLLSKDTELQRFKQTAEKY